MGDVTSTISVNVSRCQGMSPVSAENISLWKLVCKRIAVDSVKYYSVFRKGLDRGAYGKSGVSAGERAWQGGLLFYPAELD